MKYIASQSKRIKKQEIHREQTVIKLGARNIQQKPAGEAPGIVSSDPAFTTFSRRRQGKLRHVSMDELSVAGLLTVPPPPKAFLYHGIKSSNLCWEDF